MRSFISLTLTPDIMGSNLSGILDAMECAEEINLSPAEATRWFSSADATLDINLPPLLVIAGPEWHLRSSSPLIGDVTQPNPFKNGAFFVQVQSNETLRGLVVFSAKEDTAWVMSHHGSQSDAIVAQLREGGFVDGQYDKRLFLATAVEPLYCDLLMKCFTYHTIAAYIYSCRVAASAEIKSLSRKLKLDCATANKTIIASFVSHVRGKSVLL